MLPEHSRGIEIIRIPPEMPQKPSGIIHLHWIHDISKSKTTFVSKIEEDLDFFSVSKFVNSPRNNSIECIQPVS